MNAIKAIGQLMTGIAIGGFVVTMFVLLVLLLLNIAVADESIAVRPATLGEQNRSLNYPLDPYTNTVETIVIYVEPTEPTEPTEHVEVDEDEDEDETPSAGAPQDGGTK